MCTCRDGLLTSVAAKFVLNHIFKKLGYDTNSDTGNLAKSLASHRKKPCGQDLQLVLDGVKPRETVDDVFLGSWAQSTPRWT